MNRRRILLTGANGQLGRACQQQFHGQSLVLVDLPEVDITDASACRAAVAAARPDVIIHAAAYTNVKGAEGNPGPCYLANVVGTYNLAVIARELKCVLVYISTDYVFDGYRRTPYDEKAPTGPLNVYGRSKLAGELVVADLVPKHFIVRTAWLYGDGRNFVRTISALARTRPELPVVSDQLGAPTYAVDLAAMLAVIIAQGDYGVYHATNRGSATWAELAMAVLRLTGQKNRVRAISSAQARKLFNDPTPRPSYSVLNIRKLRRLTPVRFWKAALADYLAAEGARTETDNGSLGG